MKYEIRRRVAVWSATLALIAGALVGQVGTAEQANAAAVDPLAQANAQAMLQSGRLTFGHPEPQAQIQAYANGVERINPNTGRACNINDVLLQALKTVVVDRGIAISISSLNRWCENSGSTTSWHYRNGGGHAVDVNRVNGVASTGGTAQDRVYINAMTSVLPAPAGLGQYGCPGHTVTVPSGWVQFPDSCNHNHIEYRGPDVPPGGGQPTSFTISEIGAYSTGWQKVWVGQSIPSNVFAAVNMGSGWGDVFSSSNGTMLHTFVNNGQWITLDSGIPLNATSMSAVNVGQPSPHVFAVENGQIVLMYGDSAGWHKAWTGVNTTGKISAVVMSDGSVQLMISEGGVLHQMWADSAGWHKASTGKPVGDQFEALYMGGSAPQVMTILNGQVHQIWASGTEWIVMSTGVAVSSTVGFTAVDMGGGYPQVFTSEGGQLYQTAVMGGAWTRMGAGVAVNGPLDALNLGGGTARIYTTG
ncbi:hypothetical protein HF576_16475 [Microbacterium sp. CFH 90308]|uniref:Uncharacterized protein n=1 Tax=Microbacterium salsuginis TaxID=2722803 RepID=A0ABX1KEW2_9MICO|nr:hypothetical protein [Microbacterium sp. CFH 90308]NLP85444.1 hypothetical protein [Microbacterium sp. CFH 90308]